MLEIVVKEKEFYNEDTQEFINTPSGTLHLEHSLISVSKWESKWHKPFLQNSTHLSHEEIVDYVKCMTLSTNNIKSDIYEYLSPQNIDDIIAYIQDPMTATWFSEDKQSNKKPSRKNTEIITSELIYYWMVALQIPFECQKWHLNRLMTLVRVCQAKQEEHNPKSKKKPTQREMMARAEALNAQRRAQLHSKG